MIVGTQQHELLSPLIFIELSLTLMYVDEIWPISIVKKKKENQVTDQG